MLKIKIPETELFNEETSEFIYIKPQTLSLEHSLVSLAKWESKWCVPFLSTENMTIEQTLDYIKCMTLTQNVDPNVYRAINDQIIKQVSDYIALPMTATTFNERQKKTFNREIITAELIYYWMIALQIPVEFQKWHLNRLLTLVRVCSIKNEAPQKMSASERRAHNKKLNAARKSALHSHG